MRALFIICLAPPVIAVGIFALYFICLGAIVGGGVWLTQKLIRHGI